MFRAFFMKAWPILFRTNTVLNQVLRLRRQNNALGEELAL